MHRCMLCYVALVRALLLLLPKEPSLPYAEKTKTTKTTPAREPAKTAYKLIKSTSEKSGGFRPYTTRTLLSRAVPSLLIQI